MADSPRRRRQCRRCPWKISTRGRIPGGFSADARAVVREALDPGSMLAMQCHDTPDHAPLHCIGALHHMLEAGNISMRLRVIAGLDPGITTGPQHQRPEDMFDREDR